MGDADKKMLHFVSQSCFSVMNRIGNGDFSGPFENRYLTNIDKSRYGKGPAKSKFL